MPDSLQLRIGDISFGIDAIDSGLNFRPQGAVRHFVVPVQDNDVPRPEVRIEVRRGHACPEHSGEKLFDAGQLWQLYRQGPNHEFRFTAPCFGPSPYKTAKFNAEFTAGEVTLYGGHFRGNDPIYPLEYPLDELLMVNLLAQGRGVEVHGCGLRTQDGEGYLFLGQSGAGKTTTARLWSSHVDGSRADSSRTDVSKNGVAVLSDDRIILRILGGQLWMYGTPWHGEAELASAQRTPVRQMFFLARGERNEIQPLNAAHAVARLMSCSFVPFFNPSGLQFTLDFLEEVSAAAPISEYRFTPGPSAVDYIRESAVRGRGVACA